MDYEKEAPTLEGNLVILRNIDPDLDNDRFYHMFLDPEMHDWTGNTVPKSTTETYEQLKRYRDLEGLISWAIIKRDTMDFVGTYWIAPTHMEGHFIISAEAQRIGKMYWRQGYTKEARQLIYDFAFNCLGVNEIHAQAWQENVNSCRSMEATGFLLYKSEEKLFAKRNQVFKEQHYILKKENWLKHVSKSN